MKKETVTNIWLKIVSVVLAASIWFFVTYRGQSEISIDAPVEFKNIPEGLELLKQSTKGVSLNISGQERMLKSLRPMDVRVVADMSNMKKGDNVCYFDKADVLIPRTIKVLRLEPSSVKVVLDQSVARSVPVKAFVIGAPEKGFRLEGVEVTPSYVDVEGPRTEMEKVAVLRTEPIDVNGLEAGMTQNIRINTNGKNIRLKSPEVSVKIKIVRAVR